MASRARRVACIAATRGGFAFGLGPGEAAGSITFDGMTCAGTGQVIETGAGVAAFDGMIGAGTGQVIETGAGAAAFDGITCAGTGTIEDPPGETLTITLVAATWDVSVSTFRAGTSGSNYFGAFVAIPSVALGNHAFYFTHDGMGWDPQPHNAALSGYTMHAVDLAAGNRTAAQVATALEAVMASVYGDTSTATADVIVTDDIDAGSAFLGSDTPGAAGCWGCREDDIGAGGFDGNPLDSGLHAFSSFTGGPAVVSALGTRLNSAGDLVRMGLYTGGTAASGGGGVVSPAGGDLDDTDSFCETTMTGSGTGWVCQPLAPAQVHELADNTPVQYVLNGTTTSTHASFRSTGNMGDNDLNAQQLAVFDTTDMPPDASATLPATLEGVAVTASFAVALMVAFEYRTSPQRGDAGGITLAAS